MTLLAGRPLVPVEVDGLSQPDGAARVILSRLLGILLLLVKHKNSLQSPQTVTPSL